MLFTVCNLLHIYTIPALLLHVFSFMRGRMRTSHQDHVHSPSHLVAPFQHIDII